MHDPKPRRRIIASKEEWVRIRKAKAGPCRGCGRRWRSGYVFSLHHLVPRSLRGDDTEDNIIPLCGSGTTGCHGTYEGRTNQWYEVATAIRATLTDREEHYVEERASWAFLDRHYPRGGP